MLAIVLAFAVACKAPAPTPPPEPTPPIEPEKLGISFSDPSSDLFNKAGISWAGFGAYVDITKSELSLSNGYYLAKIELNSPLPAKTDDPSIFIEWDILVDSDCDAGTGWNWPLICNDIGPDYLLRLELKDSEYKGSVLNIKTNKWGSIEYKIDANIVELRFSSETIGEPANFNFVVAVRKYGERGAPQALQVADKAPNERHYVFPNHHTSPTPAELEKLEASFSDPEGDLFSYKASSVVAEPYLDIIETELSLSNGLYVAKIKLNGPLPSKIQNPAGVITWDILIDSDHDADTGLKDPVVYNDVGVDYNLLLALGKDGYGAGIGDIKAQTYTRKSIEYEIDDDTSGGLLTLLYDHSLHI